MREHYRLLSETKQQYRQILQAHQTALEARLLELRGRFHCNACEAKNLGGLKQWIEPLHEGCGFRTWQQAALGMVETEIGHEILMTLQQIETYKQTFDCHMCGMCCSMASSEAPYDELVKRAANGDEFARQFTSIFLPYPSREAARQRAPHVVDAVLAEAAEEAEGEEHIYFYHCPYLGEDNRCSVYGTDKRPAICASYPETPLSFVYEKCAWRPWKDETHVDMMVAHAMLALCTQISETLRASLSASLAPTD